MGIHWFWSLLLASLINGHVAVHSSNLTIEELADLSLFSPRFPICLEPTIPNQCRNFEYNGRFRSTDGTCNNLIHPDWGASFTKFIRHLEPVYEDDFNTPIGWKGPRGKDGFIKPNPRLVSAKVIMTKNVTADGKYSHMLMQWGQFLDHDMTLSKPLFNQFSKRPDGKQCLNTCANKVPCFPIQIPADDERLRGKSVLPNQRCIQFVRSNYVCGSPSVDYWDKTITPREQVNQLTSFIDASNVYGSTDTTNAALRFYYWRQNGHLTLWYSSKIKYMLPLDTTSSMDCERDLKTSTRGCFLAGDIRANEHLALLSMHTIWVREHNRVATALKAINPHWNGDILYNEARKIVGAQMQHISYSHWLPKIFGPKGMALLGVYRGYNSSVDPSIANVFATAAMRFGHTLINPNLTRLNDRFETIPEGNISLHRAFFAPHILENEGGVDPLLRGLFYTPAKIARSDQLVNDELTDHLFELARTVSLDLAAINIQRGRDHGIPNYNEWRKFCNMRTVQTFDDLRNEMRSGELRAKLQSFYEHPGIIDLWVAGISEDLAEDARVGPTFLCILADQFKRVRDGDRFWYENPGVFTSQQRTEISRTSLGRVLCDNGDNITQITRDVFLNPQVQSPSIVSCQTIPGINLQEWAE